MTFFYNAENIAQEAMNQLDPSLASKYMQVVQFLSEHPDQAPPLRGSSAPSIGTADYIRKQANSFYQARKPKAPKPPETIPDEMVSVMLVSYFGIAQADAERVKREHLLFIYF